MRNSLYALLTLLLLATLAKLGCGADTIKQRLAIGAPCATPDDCGSQPTFLCDPAPEHVGGYCTKECKGDMDCPSEAICALTESTGHCRLRCSNVGDCRPGYECHLMSAAASHNYCDAKGGTTGGDAAPAPADMTSADAAHGG